MSTFAKWIGGSTLVAVALIATMAFGGNALVAQSSSEAVSNDAVMASWVDGDDILAEDTSVIAAAEIVVDPAVVNQNAAAQPIQLAANEPVAAQSEYSETFVAEPVVQQVPEYDADDPFVIKSILPIDGPIRYGEWHWDDSRAGSGPLVITVDKQARVISVFRDGHEIGAAAALLGTPEHPTPVGRFPILTKERHNVSEKYNNAPMPWTLRMTWSGVAIHGGSTVELGYASHGCVGVPDEFASRLYEIAKIGDVVIVTDGVMTGVGGALGG